MSIFEPEILTASGSENSSSGNDNSDFAFFVFDVRKVSLLAICTVI